MKKLPLLTILSLIPLFSCHSDLETLPKSENQYVLTSEKDLANEQYSSKIEDFYDSGTEGTFEGKSGIEIYYKIFSQENEAKAAIMISSGRTEAALKYKEMIFDLYHNGYAVFIHDHRGQGLSGRMTEDPLMGYVDSFQYFIDDMKTFYEAYMKPGNYEHCFLLAHSMGGAIGMSYLEQHPGDFDAAGFISPMLGLKAPTCALVKILSGKNPKYAPGQHACEDYAFEGNQVTGSEIRFNRAMAAFEAEPRAKLGGASLQWAHRSCRHMRKIFADIELIETPFILFSAENEQVVDPNSHAKFIKKALKSGKKCSAYRVNHAQHEILMEKDEARMNAINAVLDFFSNYR